MDKSSKCEVVLKLSKLFYYPDRSNYSFKIIDDELIITYSVGGGTVSGYNYSYRYTDIDDEIISIYTARKVGELETIYCRFTDLTDKIRDLAGAQFLLDRNSSKFFWAGMNRYFQYNREDSE